MLNNSRVSHGLYEMAQAATDGLGHGNVGLSVGQVVRKQRKVLVSKEKPVRIVLTVGGGSGHSYGSFGFPGPVTCWQCYD